MKNSHKLNYLTKHFQKSMYRIIADTIEIFADKIRPEKAKTTGFIDRKDQYYCKGWNDCLAAMERSIDEELRKGIK